MSRPFKTKASVAAVLARMTGDPDRPYSATIEIVDRCNEVCVHCYQVQGQKQEMGTAEVKRLIDELAEMGVLLLTFSGGEPTLRHDFLELVAHARARRFSIKLYTNGLNMTAELAAKLGELAVQEAQISLYSHRPEVHDWVTGVPGSHERTVAGVRHLKNAGVSVVLKTPMMSVNAGDYPAFIELAERLGADYAFDPSLNPREDGRREPQALGVVGADYLRMAADRRIAPGGKAGAPRPTSGDDRPCGPCSSHIHVDADGEMHPCALLDVSLGNVGDGVARGWNEGPAAAGVRALRWSSLRGCRDCDLRPHCRRCHANALLESGDALGPYTMACTQAKLRYQLHHGRPPEITDDAPLGPYRERSPGVFAAAPAPATDMDRALAAKLGWTRREVRPAVAPAAPGQLVQLRRPGQAPVAMTVPGVEALSALDERDQEDQGVGGKANQTCYNDRHLSPPGPPGGEAR